MGRRTILVALVIGALAAAAVIGAAMIAACGQQASTSRQVPSERLVGWWFSDGPGPLHILKQDWRFVSVGTVIRKGENKEFAVRGAALVLVAPDASVRIELRLSPGGKSMEAVYFTKGKRVAAFGYHPGTAAEIAGYYDQLNMSWLAARVSTWLDAHGAYPPRSAVRPGGALSVQAPQPWPTNPYTGKPMAAGRQPGDYEYRFSDRGFSIKVFEPNGNAQTTYDKPSPAPTATSAAQADLQVKEGVHAIEVALQSWAVSQPSPHYPAHATRVVLSKTMSDPWPTNPFTGRAMRPGTGRGDYEYRLSANKRQLTVTSRLSDGSLYAGQTLKLQ